MSDEYRLVLCNATAKNSEKIAKALVENHLAACVNIIPGVKSVYRWEGKICIDDEQTLLIKTTKAKVEELTKTINDLHSYSLPEVICLNLLASEGESRYLQWLSSEVSAD